MNLTIRCYQPGDAASIRSLNVLALEALGPRPTGPAVEMLDRELRDIEASYIHTGGEFLVGIVDGQVVGMVALKRLNATVAEVTKMRVHPAHWRRGYGAALLRKLEQRAAELGIVELWLDTSPKQAAAEALLETWI